VTKIDIRLVIAALLGLLVSIVAIAFLSQKISGRAGVKNFFAPAATPKTIDATISLVKNKTSMTVSFVPKSQKNISAFSIRFTYDSSAQVSGTNFVPDTALLASGWSFPVKKVSVDSVTGLTDVDISAINTNPEGYVLAAPTVIGTINFEASTAVSSLTLSLDKSETKILAKDASELNYDFINK